MNEETARGDGRATPSTCRAGTRCRDALSRRAVVLEGGAWKTAALPAASELRESLLLLKLTELSGPQLSDFPCSRALRGQNAAHAPPPSCGRLRGVDASMSARAAAAASAMSCTLRACPWRPWRRVAAMGRQSPPPSRHSCGASPSDALEARAVRASPTPAQLSRRRRGVVRSELVQRGRVWCLRAR